MTEMTSTEQTEQQIPGQTGIDTTEATEQESAEVDQQDTDQTEQDEAGDEGQGNDSREAAKWRHRLRETEAERDQLADQLDAARRQIVESATGFHKPSAVWLTGAKPSAMFTDSGDLDQDAVEATVQAVMDEYGVSRRPAPGANHSPLEGRNSGPPTGAGSRWVDAFREP